MNNAHKQCCNGNQNDDNPLSPNCISGDWVIPKIWEESIWVWGEKRRTPLGKGKQLKYGTLEMKNSIGLSREQLSLLLRSLWSTLHTALMLCKDEILSISWNLPVTSCLLQNNTSLKPWSCCPVWVLLHFWSYFIFSLLTLP